MLVGICFRSFFFILNVSMYCDYLILMLWVILDFVFKDILVIFVCKELLLLCVNKFFGFKDIYLYIFKVGFSVLVILFIYIFNLLIYFGEILRLWKVVIVILFYKSGLYSDLNNFRLIFVFLVMKIFECVIYK